MKRGSLHTLSVWRLPHAIHQQRDYGSQLAFLISGPRQFRYLVSPLATLGTKLEKWGQILSNYWKTHLDLEKYRVCPVLHGLKRHYADPLQWGVYNGLGWYLHILVVESISFNMGRKAQRPEDLFQVPGLGDPKRDQSKFPVRLEIMAGKY